MGGFARGLKMCGVCGEWMTAVELGEHRYDAHRGLDHISVRGAKWTALYTVPGGTVLVLVILLGGVDRFWLGLPVILWALFIFIVCLVPVIVVAEKPSSEAYANALFRCWVCDNRVPHGQLAAHLRQNHPDGARDFHVAETCFAAITVLLPLTMILPQIWRLVDPSLPWYLFLGPELGFLCLLAFIAVYASRWPQRIARSRMEWEATHRAA